MLRICRGKIWICCKLYGKEENATEVNLSSRVVKDLMEKFQNKGHHLFTDNYYTGPELFDERSGKKQTGNNCYKNNDTFEFTRHVSVVQRPSSVESRINLKLHLNL